MAAALQAPATATDIASNPVPSAAGEVERAEGLDFRLERSVFFGLAWGLPAVTLCLGVLIYFYSRSIFQTLNTASITLRRLGRG